MPGRNGRVSLWLKVPYALFVCVVIPAYWIEYGPGNFLWGSNLALFGTLLAAWTASRVLASMMAVGVLLPEVGWTLCFIYRLLGGPGADRVPWVQYMFDVNIPLPVRALSLYHVALPVILIWLVYRLGYHRRAPYFQTLLAWIVLPVTYAVTEPSENINGVFGFAAEPQTWMPGSLYVGLLMMLYPLLIYLPTHLLFRRVCGAGR